MATMCPTRGLVQNMLSQCVMAELDYPTTHNYFREKIAELQSSYLDMAIVFENYDPLFDTIEELEGAWQFTVADIGVIRDSIVLLNAMLKKIWKGNLVTDKEFQAAKLQECGLVYKSIYGAASSSKTGYYSIIYNYNSGMIVNPMIQSPEKYGVLFGDFIDVSSSGTLNTLETKVVLNSGSMTKTTLMDDRETINPRNFIVGRYGSTGAAVSGSSDLQHLYINLNGYSFPSSINSSTDTWYPGVLGEENFHIVTDTTKGSKCYAQILFGPKTVTLYFDQVPTAVKDDKETLMYWKFINTRIVGVVDTTADPPQSHSYTTVTGLFKSPSFKQVNTFQGQNVYYYYDDEEYQPTPFAFPFYDNGRRYWYMNKEGEYVELEIDSQDTFDKAKALYGTIYVSPTEGYMSVKSGFEFVKTAAEFNEFKAKYGKLYTRYYQLFIHTYDPNRDIYEEFKKQQHLVNSLTLYKFWRGRFSKYQDPWSTNLADQRQLKYIKEFSWKKYARTFAQKFNSLVRVFDEKSGEEITADKLFNKIKYEDTSAYELLFQLGNVWAVRHELVRCYYEQLRHLLSEGNHGITVLP